MFGVTILLIFLSIICKLLASYLKKIRTGDPNESDLTYWMFSYDFKVKNNLRIIVIFIVFRRFGNRLSRGLELNLLSVLFYYTIP